MGILSGTLTDVSFENGDRAVSDRIWLDNHYGSTAPNRRYVG